MLRRYFNITKPPPYARVDLTHPLGRKCQAVSLFNNWQGTAKNAGPVSVNNFIEGPLVQFYQTQQNRAALTFGTVPPVMTYNTAGMALYCQSNFSGMDMGFVPNCECYDMDYPEFAIGATVTRGNTICVIRRKIDTSLRPSTLFGVEDVPLADTARCGAHVPYSDGTVYFDYGGLTGANRLTVSGLTWTTLVESWIFTAGPRGSNIWRNGQKLNSQSTAITRVVPAMSGHFGGWTINGGNHLAVDGAGDIQEYNFVMYVADQWSDDLCRWWSAEPYSMFYLPFSGKNYYFIGFAAGGGGGGGTTKTTEVFFN